MRRSRRRRSLIYLSLLRERRAYFLKFARSSYSVPAFPVFFNELKKIIRRWRRSDGIRGRDWINSTATPRWCISPRTKRSVARERDGDINTRLIASPRSTMKVSRYVLFHSFFFVLSPSSCSFPSDDSRLLSTRSWRFLFLSPSFSTSDESNPAMCRVSPRQPHVRDAELFIYSGSFFVFFFCMPYIRGRSVVS